MESSPFKTPVKGENDLSNEQKRLSIMKRSSGPSLPIFPLTSGQGNSGLRSITNYKDRSSRMSNYQISETDSSSRPVTGSRRRSSVRARLTPFEQEGALSYFEQHNVFDKLNELIIRIVKEKPADPEEYLLRLLRRWEASQLTMQVPITAASSISTMANERSHHFLQVAGSSTKDYYDQENSSRGAEKSRSYGLLHLSTPKSAKREDEMNIPSNVCSHAIRYMISCGLAPARSDTGLDPQTLEFFRNSENIIDLTNVFRIAYEGPLHELPPVSEPADYPASLTPIPAAEVAYSVSHRLIIGISNDNFNDSSSLPLPGTPSGVKKRSNVANDARLSALDSQSGTIGVALQFRLIMKITHFMLSLTCYPQERQKSLVQVGLLELIGFEGYYICKNLITNIYNTLLAEMKARLSMFQRNPKLVKALHAAFRDLLYPIVQEFYPVLDSLSLPSLPPNSSVDVIAEQRNAVLREMPSFTSITESQIQAVLITSRGTLLHNTPLSTLAQVIRSISSGNAALLADQLLICGFFDPDDLAAIIAASIRCTRPSVYAGCNLQFQQTHLLNSECVRELLSRAKKVKNFVDVISSINEEKLKRAFNDGLFDRTLKSEFLWDTMKQKVTKSPEELNASISSALAQCQEVEANRIMISLIKIMEGIISPQRAFYDLCRSGVFLSYYGLLCQTLCASLQLSDPRCTAILLARWFFGLYLQFKSQTPQTSFNTVSSVISHNSNNEGCPNMTDYKITQYLHTYMSQNKNSGRFIDSINPVLRSRLKNADKFLSLSAWDYVGFAGNYKDTRTWEYQAAFRMEQFCAQGFTPAEMTRVLSIPLQYVAHAESAFLEAKGNNKKKRVLSALNIDILEDVDIPEFCTVEGASVMTSDISEQRCLLEGEMNLGTLIDKTVPSAVAASAFSASIFHAVIFQLLTSCVPRFVTHETEVRWKMLEGKHRTLVAGSAETSTLFSGSTNSEDALQILIVELGKLFCGKFDVTNFSMVVLALLRCGVFPCSMYSYFGALQESISVHFPPDIPPLFLFSVRRTTMFMLSNLNQVIFKGGAMIDSSPTTSPILEAWDEFLNDPGSIFDCCKVISDLIPSMEYSNTVEWNDLRDKVRLEPQTILKVFLTNATRADQMELGVWLALHFHIPRVFPDAVALALFDMFTFRFAGSNTESFSELILMQHIDNCIRNIVAFSMPRVEDMERIRATLSNNIPDLLSKPPEPNLIQEDHDGSSIHSRKSSRSVQEAFSETDKLSSRDACTELNAEQASYSDTEIAIMNCFTSFQSSQSSYRRQTSESEVTWWKNPLCVEIVNAIGMRGVFGEEWAAHEAIEFVKDLLCVVSSADLNTAALKFRELFSHILSKGCSIDMINLFLSTVLRVMECFKIRFHHHFNDLLSVILRIHIIPSYDDHSNTNQLIQIMDDDSTAFQKFCTGRDIVFPFKALYLYHKTLLRKTSSPPPEALPIEDHPNAFSAENSITEESIVNDTYSRIYKLLVYITKKIFASDVKPITKFWQQLNSDITASNDLTEAFNIIALLCCGAQTVGFDILVSFGEFQGKKIHIGRLRARHSWSRTMHAVGEYFMYRVTEVYKWKQNEVLMNTLPESFEQIDLRSSIQALDEVESVLLPPGVQSYLYVVGTSLEYYEILAKCLYVCIVEERFNNVDTACLRLFKILEGDPRDLILATIVLVKALLNHLFSGKSLDPKYIRSQSLIVQRLFFSCTNIIMIQYCSSMKQTFERVVSDRKKSVELLDTLSRASADAIGFEPGFPLLCNEVMPNQITVVTSMLARTLSATISSVYSVDPKHSERRNSLGEKISEENSHISGHETNSAHESEDDEESPSLLRFHFYRSALQPSSLVEMLASAGVLPRDLSALSRTFAHLARKLDPTVDGDGNADNFGATQSLTLCNSFGKGFGIVDNIAINESKSRILLQSLCGLWKNYLCQVHGTMRMLIITSNIPPSSEDRERISEAYSRIQSLLYVNILKNYNRLGIHPYIDEWQLGLLLQATGLCSFEEWQRLENQRRGEAMSAKKIFDPSSSESGIVSSLRLESGKRLSSLLHSRIILDVFNQNSFLLVRTLISTFQTSCGASGNELASILLRSIYLIMVNQRAKKLTETFCMTRDECETRSTVWKNCISSGKRGSEVVDDWTKGSAGYGLNIPGVISSIANISSNESDKLLACLEDIITNKSLSIFCYSTFTGALSTFVSFFGSLQEHTLCTVLSPRWTTVSEAILTGLAINGANTSQLISFAKLLQSIRFMTEVVVRIRNRRSTIIYLRRFPHTALKKYLFSGALQKHIPDNVPHPVDADVVSHINGVLSSLATLFSDCENLDALDGKNSNLTFKGNSQGSKQALKVFSEWVERNALTREISVQTKKGKASPPIIPKKIFFSDVSATLNKSIEEEVRALLRKIKLGTPSLLLRLDNELFNRSEASQRNELLNFMESKDKQMSSVSDDQEEAQLYGGVANSFMGEHLRIFLTLTVLFSSQVIEVFKTENMATSSGLTALSNMEVRVGLTPPESAKKPTSIAKQSLDASQNRTSTVAQQGFTTFSKALIETVISACVEKLVTAQYKIKTLQQAPPNSSLSPIAANPNDISPFASTQGKLRVIFEQIMAFVHSGMTSNVQNISEAFSKFEEPFHERLQEEQITFQGFCTLCFELTSELKRRGRMQAPIESIKAAEQLIATLCRTLYTSYYQANGGRLLTEKKDHSIGSNRLSNGDNFDQDMEFLASLDEEKSSGVSGAIRARKRNPKATMLTPQQEVSPNDSIVSGSNSFQSASPRSTAPNSSAAASNLLARYTNFAEEDSGTPDLPQYSEASMDQESESTLFEAGNTSIRYLLAAHNKSRQSKDVTDQAKDPLVYERNEFPFSSFKVFVYLWAQLLPDLLVVFSQSKSYFTTVYYERTQQPVSEELFRSFLFLLHKIAIACTSDSWIHSHAINKIVEDWVQSPQGYKGDYVEELVASAVQALTQCMNARSSGMFYMSSADSSSSVSSLSVGSSARSIDNSNFSLRTARTAWDKVVSYLSESIIRENRPPSEESSADENSPPSSTMSFSGRNIQSIPQKLETFAKSQNRKTDLRTSLNSGKKDASFERIAGSLLQQKSNSNSINPDKMEGIVDESQSIASKMDELSKGMRRVGSEKLYTMEEVRAAHTPDRTWTVISGVVYDITRFVHGHPGGMELMLQACAGQDSTDAFFKYHRGNSAALQQLERLNIGIITQGKKK